MVLLRLSNYLRSALFFFCSLSLCEITVFLEYMVELICEAICPEGLAWENFLSSLLVISPFKFCMCCILESESEVAQSCPTLCDPVDRSLPGSSVHGIFQARVLEWVLYTYLRVYLLRQI